MFPVAFDTETELVAPFNKAPRLVCCSVDAGAGPVLWHHTDSTERLIGLLEIPSVLIVGHNIAYDMCVMLAHDYSLAPLIFRAYQEHRITDTEIRQKLIDIAAGIYRGFESEDGETHKILYTLEDVSRRLLNRQLDKDTWRLRYGELRDLPLEAWPEGAKQYALDDATATLDVYQSQQVNAHVLEDEYRQAYAAFWIKLMTTWGIHTDAAGVQALADRTQAHYQEIARGLRAAGLLRADRINRKGETVPGSRDTKVAMQRVVATYLSQGLPVPLTDGGKPSTSKKVCKESGDPILISYADLSSTGKILATDIPLLFTGTVQPIHVYCETMLETGRTSTRPNIQNQKRKGGLRECFVPRPGYHFIASDYGGLELATLAQVCKTILGYSALGDAINKGADPHMMVASQILGMAYDWCKDQHDNHGSDYDRVDNARQVGKVANFGFPGSLGFAALVHFAASTYGVAITEEQAQELKRVWFATWPEMRDYFNWVTVQTDGADPRICHLTSNRYRGGLSYTEACNSMFQGLGADVAKSAGCRIAEGCYLLTDSPLFGCRIVNFVHDEFILEAPEHRSSEAALELSRVMVEAAKAWLPDVRIASKPVIMKRWSKDAKQIWENGRLMAWDVS
jgi:DNA polymerase-1